MGSIQAGADFTDAESEALSLERQPRKECEMRRPSSLRVFSTSRDLLAPGSQVRRGQGAHRKGEEEFSSRAYKAERILAGVRGGELCGASKWAAMGAL